LEALKPITQGKTLSIMPTWQCTAACKSCGTLSSPKEDTWLDPQYVHAAIREASQLGYMVVVFTGGEPTLAGPGLLRAIEHATDLGMTTRVVTNAWWATKPADAQRRINCLKRAGLVEINFSTGDQHARFVPVENVLFASQAALRSGLRTVVIMVETLRKRHITKDFLRDHPMWKKIQAEFPSSAIIVNESPWMPLSPSRTNTYAAGMTINRKNLRLRNGCTNILTTTTLQANGSLAACCGLGMRTIPELQLGNIRSTTLSQAEDLASSDFLKRWIRIEGPEHILAWAAEKDPTIEWEDMYAHHCQACARIYQDPRVRTIIREHYEEKLPEVTLRDWLLYDYDQENHEEPIPHHDLIPDQLAPL
jgi:hypothetical protein